MDKHFYDSAYNENHKFLFGSYKLRTPVRPIVPEQDVDVLFEIDYTTYVKYQNNPAGLLQEVRKTLKEKYTTTDIIKAWGKVVLIQFSDGTHNVKVLPAYETTSGKFYIPNTENGVEFWDGRELAPYLGYTQWRNFESVIEKTKDACKTASGDVLSNFADVSKIVKPVLQRKSTITSLPIPPRVPPVAICTTTYSGSLTAHQHRLEL